MNTKREPRVTDDDIIESDANPNHKLFADAIWYGIDTHNAIARTLQKRVWEGVAKW